MDVLWFNPKLSLPMYEVMFDASSDVRNGMMGRKEIKKEI